jgi:hypothetical protein
MLASFPGLLHPERRETPGPLPRGDYEPREGIIRVIFYTRINYIKISGERKGVNPDRNSILAFSNMVK